MTEIEFEVLEDGTLRWKTGKVPTATHTEVEKLQEDLEQYFGEVQRRQISGKPVHTHQNDHVHEHDHGHE